MDKESTAKSVTREKKDAWVGAIWANVKRLLPVIGILAVAILGAALYNALFPAPVPPTQSEIDERIQQAIASATPDPAYSTAVYQIIFPSLVFIQTEAKNTDGDAGYGLGSGVIVNQAGDILTANHVVDGASSITVHFTDGSKSAAQVIAAEPENDIALLRPVTPPQVIVPAVLGSLGAMRVGDEAYAVGNPLGLTASMSAGVISGFNRSIPIETGSQDRLDGLIYLYSQEITLNP